MHYGIQEATRQIKKTQDKRASIIIALTDGRLVPQTKTRSVREVCDLCDIVLSVMSSPF